MLLLISLLGCLSVSLFAQQDFYDINTVNDIHLYFTQSNWDAILDQLYESEERLVGTAVINGVTYDSVGVRYKGNSSYSANRNKNPFNIKLDHVIEDQLIGPYGTIKLANGFSDPSFIRETLAYEIARKYVPASKANYANVYVNDQLIGVYTSVQDVDSYFMNEYFHCSGMPRFKCGTNTMNAVTVWGYLGTNPSSYDTYYDLESDEGWDTLINFTNTLQNDYINIDEVMNVDQNLWMCVFDNLLVNLDSPINNFHNFYLFSDADNRINPLLWDLNMAFGGFQGGTVTQMQQLNPLRNFTSNTFLLLKNAINNDAHYKKMYLAHMRTMINENFSNGWYATRAAELQAICGPYVQADPNYFYTYANFQANLNSAVSGGSGGPGGGQSVPGITQLMNTRATWLLSNSNFSGTVPSLVSQSYSPQSVQAGEDLQFTVTLTDANYVQLGFRQNHAHKFNYYQMFDDGVHGDGAAGDLTYGISVPVSSGDIEYYFWAENSSQGMFFPPRAEFEFFTIAGPVNTGELVFNEIMAKNASFPDPNGELDDWVEIYNPNDYAVNIGGMYMTDSHYTSGISSWTQIPTSYPNLTTITPHGYVVIWYDENLDQGPLHVNDKLGGGADAVYLIAADGETVIDSFVWTEATDLNVDDRSIGRLPDGASNWVLFGSGQANPVTQGTANQGDVNVLPHISAITYSPTSTTAQSLITVSASINDQDGSLTSVYLKYGVNDPNLNTLTMTANGSVYSAQIGPFAEGTHVLYRIEATDNNNGTTQSAIYTIVIGYNAPDIYINEFMPSNTATLTDENNEYDDWAELYNPNGFEINLAGYYLTDNHYPDPTTLYQIPWDAQNAGIPAHGFRILWFDEQPDQGALHINTKLGTSADAIYLLAPDMLNVLDSVVWTADTGLVADLSYGRYPDGSTTWTLFGGDNPHPVSPGTTNVPVANDDETLPGITLKLSVYPNPAKDALFYELQGAKKPYQLKVYNLKGQLVNEFSTLPETKTAWNILDKNGKRVGSGIYFLTAEANGKHFNKKICIVQ